MNRRQFISSRQHPIVKHLIKLRQDRHFRYEQSSVCIEGKKLVKEVCQQISAKKIVSTSENLIPLGIDAEEIYLVPEGLFEKISGLSAPEGLLAEVPMPFFHSLNKMNWVIAFEGINDPGNLGTLIRTALALGWQGAFLLENCCDPYNEKAIRAAKGATFRLPLSKGSWNDLKELIVKNNLKPFMADLQGENVKRLDPLKKVLLVLSNESRGPSQQTELLCKSISIPMPGEMESLNVAVAGAILMYQLRGNSDG